MRDRYDSNGDLRPFMLSELIDIAQKTMAEHGDLVVAVHIDELAYDDTIKHTGPAIDVHIAKYSTRLRNYWKERRFEKTFSIEGQQD